MPVWWSERAREIKFIEAHRAAKLRRNIQCERGGARERERLNSKRFPVQQSYEKLYNAKELERESEKLNSERRAAQQSYVDINNASKVSERKSE